MANSSFKDSLNIDKMLAQMKADAKVLRKLVKSAGNITAKAARIKAPVETPNVSRPGDKQLKDTIINKIKVYDSVRFMSIVGPNEDEGPHGRLVELGHNIVARGKAGESNRGGDVIGQTQAKKWFAPAIDGTQQEVNRFIEKGTSDFLKGIGG